MVETIVKVIDRPVKIVPADGPPFYEDMVKMFNWFNEKGYEVDIPI